MKFKQLLDWRDCVAADLKVVSTGGDETGRFGGGVLRPSWRNDQNYAGGQHQCAIKVSISHLSFGGRAPVLG